jgi:hypothetical protein
LQKPLPPSPPPQQRRPCGRQSGIREGRRWRRDEEVWKMFARNKMCGSYTVYTKRKRGGKKYTKISKREVHGKRPVILAHAQLGCWIDHAERGSLSRALISLQQHCRPQRAEPGLCITRPKTQQQAALYMYSLYLLARRENRRQIPSIKATDPSQSKRGRCGVWW